MNNLKKGLLLALLNTLCFTAISMIMKHTKGSLSPAVMIFSRNLLVVLFVIPVLIKQGIQRPTLKVIGLYIIRALIVYAAMHATYYAYRNLPLPIATAIGYTEPMMQVLIATFFLHEKVSRKFWIALVIGWIGTLLIAYGKQGGASHAFTLAVIIALLANMAASTSKAMAKYLTRKQAPHEIMFYSNFSNFLTSAVMLAFLPSQLPQALPSTFILALLPTAALFSFIAQFAYTKALSLTHMHVLSPVNYVRLLFAIPIGFLFFNETLTLQALAGSFIIIAANYAILRSYHTKKGSPHS